MAVAKGSISPDAAMTNQYDVKIGAILPITATRVSGLERRVKTVTLPDQTIQPTGQVAPLDGIEIDVPAHHTAEIAAMEALHALAVGGLPLNKSEATVFFRNVAGSPKLTYLLPGLMVVGRKPSELNAGSDGTMAVVTWMCTADDAILI